MSTVETLEAIDRNPFIQGNAAGIQQALALALPQARLEAKVIEAVQDALAKAEGFPIVGDARDEEWLAGYKAGAHSVMLLFRDALDALREGE